MKDIKEVHNNNNVRAIYKANIFEYEDGTLDILFVCDIEKNKECDKRYCSADCCTHTLDKKYAKNYLKN